MSNLYSDLRAEYINEWRIWYRMCKRCNDSIRYYVEVKIVLDEPAIGFYIKAYSKQQVADMLDEYYIVTLDQTD